MPIKSTVKISTKATPSSNILIIGRRKEILNSNIGEELQIPSQIWQFLCSKLTTKKKISTLLNKKEVVVALLPEKCSRHNSPSRAWAISDLAALANGKDNWDIIICTEEAHLEAAAIAVAKAFPQYSAKTSQTTNRDINLLLYAGEQFHAPANLPSLMKGVALAAELFDRPTNSLNVSDFVEEAKKLAKSKAGITISVIQGEELKDKGFGGLWGVGKAAIDPPALVCLDWSPKGATKRVAWIGKGIVYDTGGLSIKSKNGMPNMKGDMGGAAAVFGAFYAAVHNEVSYSISAILCLAENAVGPDATRPDDVLQLYSGKTVEINNTDAEGRLVLADGIAWAAKTLSPDLLIDIATLTGAAPSSVGKKFAALYCNRDDLEKWAVDVGKKCGECCHPLPYVPEFFSLEFTSQIADMKNSVKDRANAQSSCAGQFINNHLPNEEIPWLHIDIAGPAWNGQKRGTGYGVALLLNIGTGR